jgi:hypothetical protein
MEGLTPEEEDDLGRGLRKIFKAFQKRLDNEKNQATTRHVHLDVDMPSSDAVRPG